MHGGPARPERGGPRGARVADGLRARRRPPGAAGMAMPARSRRAAAGGAPTPAAALAAGLALLEAVGGLAPCPGEEPPSGDRPALVLVLFLLLLLVLLLVLLLLLAL
ncbi:unnamed protein product, partial [Prorocentrum cordatum]